MSHYKNTDSSPHKSPRNNEGTPMQSDSVFDLESKFDNSKSKKKRSNKINKEKENSLLNEKYQPTMNRVESKEFIAENGVIHIENTLDLPNSLARTENTVVKDKKSLITSENTLELPNSLARTENTVEKEKNSIVMSENTLELPDSLARTENTVVKDKKLIAISDTKSKQSGVSSITNRSKNIKSNKSDLFSVTIKSLSNSGQLYQVNASGVDITKITDIVTTG